MRSRQAILLIGLTKLSFKAPPKGVGLKTIFAARDAGLIETDENFSPPKCRLTQGGYIARGRVLGDESSRQRKPIPLVTTRPQRSRSHAPHFHAHQEREGDTNRAPNDWPRGTRAKRDGIRDQALSSKNAFVAELIRAANQVERISTYEQRRLLDRAVTTIKDMRESIGIPRSARGHDTLSDLKILSVQIDAIPIAPQEVREALLMAAGMIRDLHIVIDTGVSFNFR